MFLRVARMNPYWLVIAFTLLTQLFVFLKWLHRRVRDSEIERAFLRDLAVYHLPHIYRVVESIAAHFAHTARPTAAAALVRSLRLHDEQPHNDRRPSSATPGRSNYREELSRSIDIDTVQPQPELVALARDAARRHLLWPELVCAVIDQESNWIPWALRYEPAFYDRYVQPQFARGAIGCEGEARSRAFSWGLMQVMGQVAREQGFAGPSSRRSLRTCHRSQHWLPRADCKDRCSQRQCRTRTTAVEWRRK